MLIAGSINFVVFMRKRNDYEQGGRLTRMVESVREVTGVDGRVLSSEVFALDGESARRGGHAVAHAPISCLDDLLAHGYQPHTMSRWS
ncbi:MAG TPA: CpaF family protein, partial [Marmoricola sp.]|nr:CpaF family protein [Marmoricola sp.]